MQYLGKLTRKAYRLPILFFLNLLFAFHYYLIIYINSPYLESLISRESLSTLYIAASIANLLLLLVVPLLIEKVKPLYMLLAAVAIELVAVLAMSLGGTLALTVVGFFLHQSIVIIVVFLMDLFVESATPKESSTGNIRGIYLTLSNSALVLAPFLVSIILYNDNYESVYLLSALLLIPFFVLCAYVLSKARGIGSHHLTIPHTLSKIWKDKNLRNVILAHSILQFFYAWMVVYLPIYLHNEIGFAWSELGILFSIMLLPFVFFEIPVGRIADKYLGEKEMMIFGFAVISISASMFSAIGAPTFILWAIVLFSSRVGASFAEITTESYFFKHVKAHDAGIVSIFRITRPLSFITAPVAATIFFLFLDYRYAFIALGFTVLFGLFFALKIKDTK